MTVVVNMLGGSGIGKSTTAAGLYSAMKSADMNVELVREYVKSWAWDGKKVGQYDQIYIFGKQARSEYMLYDKVDFIITDSPILLSPIYEKYYNGESMIEEAAVKFLNKAKSNGVVHENFVLERNKQFNPQGRYETEEQAKEVDQVVRNFLKEKDISYELVDCSDEQRVPQMLRYLQIKYVERSGR
jgi:nicotinamide riboside kinase